MTQPTHVYAFISDNHELYGLSVVSNGSNMPTGTGVAIWEKREEPCHYPVATSDTTERLRKAGVGLIEHGSQAWH